MEFDVVQNCATVPKPLTVTMFPPITPAFDANPAGNALKPESLFPFHDAAFKAVPFEETVAFSKSN